MNVNDTKRKNQVVTANIVEQQELLAKWESIKIILKASAWRELGINVVQINPYTVKQTTEVKYNNQLKDDTKNPKLIANLVKDGKFGMPYWPESLYTDLCRVSIFRDQLNEDSIRTINRLHIKMKIYFPEYKDAYWKIYGQFSIDILKEAPFSEYLK